MLVSTRSRYRNWYRVRASVPRTDSTGSARRFMVSWWSLSAILSTSSSTAPGSSTWSWLLLM